MGNSLAMLLKLPDYRDTPVLTFKTERLKFQYRSLTPLSSGLSNLATGKLLRECSCSTSVVHRNLAINVLCFSLIRCFTHCWIYLA